MTDWLQLLVGSVLAGTAIVWAMVLPRRLAFLPALAAPTLGALAIKALGSIAGRYQTVDAIGAAAFLVLAGCATGYAISAAALPGIAVLRGPRTRPVSQAEPKQAVIVLACTDPERYDPRAVAALGAELERDAAIDIPLFTTPLVYLAERTRYRVFGGHSPGPAIARAVVTAAATVLPQARFHLAWTYDRPALAELVANAAVDGADRVAVVVLGAADSPPVERALAAVKADRARTPALAVCVASSLWRDGALAERLAARILESIGDEDDRRTGVALLCPGQPPVAGTDRPEAAADDAYFGQRVRMLLTEAGIDAADVRMAWLEWQQPDLTETARHLAALGCTRIVVAPCTIALPTVSTSLDIRHALDTARLPGDVATMVLAPWGDDPVLIDAVVRCAAGALGPD